VEVESGCVGLLVTGMPVCGNVDVGFHLTSLNIVTAFFQ